jgi:hypothetical protein
VLTPTCFLAECVAVEVEQCDEDGDDADRVDHDEEGSNHSVGLVGTGVAVDGEIILMI